VSPAPQLALEKQARLCLTVAHETCATFEAARAAIEDAADDGPSSGHGPAQRVRRWSVPRTQATVLDVGRGSVDFGAVARQRSSAQVALVLLALVAFGTLILSRLSGDPSAVAAAPTASLPVVATSATASPTTLGAVASPTIDLTPAPAITPTPTVAPPPTPTAPSSAGPSASPVATPAGSFRLYRVRSGDTLSAIAARFHTTTRALAAENGISDPTRLQIGQVLRIPG
jgi:LysM repeat protein